MNKPSVVTTFALIALMLALIVHAEEIIRLQHAVTVIQNKLAR